jgi:hypothetical protein
VGPAEVSPPTQQAHPLSSHPALTPRLQSTQPSPGAVSRSQEAEALWPQCRGALAVWVFFQPTFTANGGLAAALKQLGAANLTRDGRIPHKHKVELTLQQAHQIEQAYPGSVVIIPQHAGGQVFVPPGWPHQVLNLRPCVKVAWERCRRGWYYMYALHMCTVVPQFARMADDYLGFQQLVFRELNSMM